MELSGWGITPNPTDKPEKVINIIGEINYELTEVFEFLSRLAKKGLYNEGVRVSITLNDTEGRKLIIRDAMRMPLFDEYRAAGDKIEFVKEYTKDDLLTKPKDLALEVILYIFERFAWDNPPINVIKGDQEKLLEGRP